jgi:hypothetical protein
MAESELILLLSNKILTDKAELAQLELKNERLQFESRTKLIHRYVALYKYLNEMLQKNVKRIRIFWKKARKIAGIYKKWFLIH